MRVAVYYNNRDVRIEDRPIPEIGADELLLKVEASGICGSDVMEWYRVKKAPLVLGHEVTGEIAKVGKHVTRYKVSDRVFVSHHVPCNTCRFCLKGQHTACETLHVTNFDPGGFSEFIRVPALNADRGVFLLPHEISYEEGAFIEPLGCTIRAQRIAHLDVGDTVLVIGSGLSGLLHIALARARGAGKIIATDISKFRLDAAKRFGADETFLAVNDLPGEVRKINDGYLADLVILCTGAPAVYPQALQAVERGGVVLFFATTSPDYQLPLCISDIWRNGVTLLPSYGAAPVDIQLAIELIRYHRIPVREMITHRLPLEDAGVGFRLVAEAQNSLKVILQPHAAAAERLSQ